jgi:transcriptional regulator with XRE-family HTH domain
MNDSVKIMSLTKSKGKCSLRTRFATNVRAARVAQGISQEKLAELGGFHRTYVSQVERGVTNVSLDNVERLAVVLGVDAGALLTAQSGTRKN